METEAPQTRVIPAYVSSEMDEKLGSASIVLLFGPSGSGKTSFANAASGDSMKVGNGVKSCTQKVEVSELFYLDEKPVVIVDCPGFDDTYLTEADILQYLVDFLTHIYSNKFELAGLIYMHRIIDPRVGGTSLRHMNMFKAICGVESLKNAVYVTNMWSDPPTENELAREVELNQTNEFFHGPIAEGAQTTRHLGTRESAHDILRLLTDKGLTITTLQRQLVDEQMKLEDTDVGRLLGQALEEAMLHHQQQVEELNAEQERAAEIDNQAWSQRLEEEAKKAEERGRQLAAQLSLLQGRGRPGDPQEPAEQKPEQIKPEGQRVERRKPEQRKIEPRPTSHSASTRAPDMMDMADAMARLQKMMDESNQKYERGMKRNQAADAKRERDLNRQANARIAAANAGAGEPRRSSSSGRGFLSFLGR